MPRRATKTGIVTRGRQIFVRRMLSRATLPLRRCRCPPQASRKSASARSSSIRQSGELFKLGHKLNLHGQPIEVLSILLERPGEVVTREELCQRLWPEDTFVDFEHSLNTAIKKLRQALDDDPDAPRYIETLPKKGYRFIAQVEAVANGIAPVADRRMSTRNIYQSNNAEHSAPQTTPLETRRRDYAASGRRGRRTLLALSPAHSGRHRHSSAHAHRQCQVCVPRTSSSRD